MKSRARKEKAPCSFVQRTYRQVEQSGLISTYVRVVETDLHILAPRDVENEAMSLVLGLRKEIEDYISRKPIFLNTLRPMELDSNAPSIVRKMLAAAARTGVGPMAAVAGAIAEDVGFGLLDRGIDDLIVENGGDIFLSRTRESIISVFAGHSSLSHKVGIRILAPKMPCGVCCSSGTVGHSLSMGKADAVVVVAESTPLADAAATRIGNEVLGGKESISKGLKCAQQFEGISGVLIIVADQLGAWGDLELVRI